MPRTAAPRISHYGLRVGPGRGGRARGARAPNGVRAGAGRGGGRAGRIKVAAVAVGLVRSRIGRTNRRRRAWRGGPAVRFVFISDRKRRGSPPSRPRRKRPRPETYVGQLLAASFDPNRVPGIVGRGNRVRREGGPLLNGKRCQPNRERHVKRISAQIRRSEVRRKRLEGHSPIRPCRRPRLGHVVACRPGRTCF